MNFQQIAYQESLWIVNNLNIIAKLEANQKLETYTHNNRKYFKISPGKNTFISLYTPVDYSEAPKTVLEAAKHLVTLATNEFSKRVFNYMPDIDHLKLSFHRFYVNNFTGSNASFSDTYIHLDSLFKTTSKMVEVTEACYSEHYKEILENIKKAWQEVSNHSLSNELSRPTGLAAILESYSYVPTEKDMIATFIYETCRKPESALLKKLDNKIKKIDEKLKNPSEEQSEVHKTSLYIPEVSDGENIFDIYSETLELLRADSIVEFEPDAMPIPYANRFRTTEDDNFYINASVMCDGFAIASSHPKDSIEGDFFKMLWFSQTLMIVDLDMTEEVKFLDQEIKMGEKGLLKTKGICSDDPHEFKIELTLNEEKRRLSGFRLTMKSTDLFDTQECLNLIRKVVDSGIDLKKNPLVVYSRNGESRSAIFLTVLRAISLSNEAKNEDEAFRKATKEVYSRETGRAFQKNNNSTKAYELFKKFLHS